MPKQYYDVMDPFVSLSSAAAVTKTIKVGTGVCLVIQRDTIQTAKLVASLDQVSNGRFLFGIGGGWNRDEMEDHGTVYATRFKKMREQIEAMRSDLDREQARISRRDRRFPADDDLAEAGAEAASPPVIVGGMFPHAARRAIRYGNGWIPHSRRPQYEDVTDYLPQFREMMAEAGRDLAEVPVTVWGVQPDLDRLKRYRGTGGQPRRRAAGARAGREDTADPRSLGRTDPQARRRRLMRAARRTGVPTRHVLKGEPA